MLFRENTRYKFDSGLCNYTVVVLFEKCIYLIIFETISSSSFSCKDFLSEGCKGQAITEN